MQHSVGAGQRAQEQAAAAQEAASAAVAAADNLRVRISDLEAEIGSLTQQLACARGELPALQQLPTCAAVEQLERDVVSALGRIQPYRARRADEERTRRERHDECIVCMEAAKDVVFVPCGHLVACMGCAASLENCPTCRAPITQRIRTFVN